MIALRVFALGIAFGIAGAIEYDAAKVSSAIDRANVEAFRNCAAPGDVRPMPASCRRRIIL